MVEYAGLFLVGCQAGILCISIVALRRGDFATVTNGVVSLLASLVPTAIEITAPLLGATVSVDPVLPLWIALAGLLHTYGMLGPYDTLWWWDKLTHTLSAGLVAALFYAGLVVAVDQGLAGLPTTSVVPLTIAWTVAAGVFWEVIELVARDVGERFDVEPVLVHYGWRDTAVDLVFDVVGVLLVVLLDLRVFVPLAQRWPETATTLLLWSGGVFIVGSVVLCLLLARPGRSEL